MAGKYAVSHDKQKLLAARKLAARREMTAEQRKDARKNYDRKQQLQRRHEMSTEMAKAVGSAYRGGQSVSTLTGAANKYGGKTGQLIRWILQMRKNDQEARGPKYTPPKGQKDWDREHRDWVPPDEPTGDYVGFGSKK